MVNKKIVLLAGPGNSTKTVHHFLEKEFGLAATIIEEKVSGKQLVKRRIKNLGIFTVIGQLAFQTVIAKLLSSGTKGRIQQILQKNGLSALPIPENKITYVSSVNADETLAKIREIKPDLIVINGTRIIGKRLIKNAKCKMLNTHAGITPKYRGVHGAYWALVNKDHEHCGVTVHFVDAGIDTGNILYQATIKPEAEDNFSSYPTLQLAAGMPLLKQAVEDVLNNNAQTIDGPKESFLWYHPTIWQYLYNRIFKGVK